MNKLIIYQVWPASEGDVRIPIKETFYRCLGYENAGSKPTQHVLKESLLVKLAQEYFSEGGEVIFGTNSGAFSYSPPNAEEGTYGVFYFTPVRLEFQDDLVRAFQKASPLPNFNF